MDVSEAGRLGGKMRMSKLSKKERSKLAKQAAETRWTNYKSNKKENGRVSR